MPRARSIKHSFFTNDDLADFDPIVRLLFIGLWTLADREGRIEDRPRRIKAMLFPYDEFDVNDAIQCLHGAKLVQRYEIDNTHYIQVVNFSKHQNPHIKERKSTIPAPCKHHASTVKESLTPDTLTPDCGKDTASNLRFDEWWKEYPKKVEKKKARQIWTARKLDRVADQIIEDTKRRPDACAKWRDGFICNPTTYLRGDRWNDEYEKPRRQNGNGKSETAIQARERRNREAIERANRGEGLTAPESHGGHVAPHG